MEMEVDNLDYFLKNCCRVCLSVENESKMLDSSNIVQNFNKTIDQLLVECANLKFTNDINYPKQLCEDCVTELVMVTKFHEKCRMSTVALDQFKQQIEKLNESKQVPLQISIANAVDSEDADLYYESVDYCDENVEYVMYDSSANIIEDTYIPKKAHETQEIDAVHQRTYNLTIDKATSPRSNSRRRCLNSSRKMKQTVETDSGLSMKSVIRYHCKMCGAGFAQINNYTKHLQTHNDNESETSAIINEHQESIEVENNVEVGTEDAEHPSTVSAQRNQIIPEKKYRKNLQKNHICQHCGRAFPSVSLLTTHNRIHTGERPYSCDTCGKTFKTQGALDLHEKRHKGLKSYICTVCNKGFVESSNLKVHMRIHTGERPHTCVTCGRNFSRVFLLQIHQRTHTGEKPYACDNANCDKSFAQQGDLAAHRRIHSGERPHICKICNRGFIKSSGLTQHMRRHFRPTKTNSSHSAENIATEKHVQIEIIDIKPNINITDLNSKEAMDCRKDHSESFQQYLKN